jgi:hypothetical protein
LSGLERVFIPSRVGDNPYLGEDYVNQLRASGSKELVRAWLEGDWSVIEGAFFDRFSMRNVVEPFVVPKKSLTGDTTERVDTRVLQVIYEFDPAGRPPLFVGQQVEVFIDAAK